jgi:hypothetical protein
MAKTNKPHGTDSEILLLIHLKRERAVESMCKILSPFKGEGGKTYLPSPVFLLDYLTNMVFAIELVLKLLADNWKDHEVSDLYKAVFRTDYKDAALLNAIRAAILNQKYFAKPREGLQDRIPDLERLYKSLMRRLCVKYQHFTVHTDVVIPEAVGQYLLANLPDFFEKRPLELHEIARGLDEYLSRYRQIDLMHGTGAMLDLFANIHKWNYEDHSICDTCKNNKVSDDAGESWRCERCP